MSADGRMPNSGMQVPPHWSSWKAPRRRRWTANNAPAANGNNKPPRRNNNQSQGLFPAPQAPAEPFLPTTPGFEAGRRGLEDTHAANLMNITNAQNLIGPQVEQQTARLGTDRTYANQALDVNLADRGIYASSVNPYLRNRDINIPFGRQEQDLATWAASQYGDLSSQLSAEELAYAQAMAELTLDSAAEAAANVPLNVPQYSAGTNNRPDRPRRKNRPRNNGRDHGRGKR